MPGAMSNCSRKRTTLKTAALKQSSLFKFMKTYFLLKSIWVRGVAKVAEWEDTELTSSHRYNKITFYRAPMYKNNVKTSRKDFPQLKIKTEEREL